jgi:hypothetical protein
VAISQYEDLWEIVSFLPRLLGAIVYRWRSVILLFRPRAYAEAILVLLFLGNSDLVVGDATWEFLTCPPIYGFAGGVPPLASETQSS